MKRGIKLLFLWLVIPMCFFAVISNANAEYISGEFGKGVCSAEQIPDNATTNFEVSGDKYILTEQKYSDFKPEKTNDGSIPVNPSVIGSYVYFSLSENEKTVVAYVPNYSEAIKDSEKLDGLKLLGLYDESLSSCNNTYVASTRLVYRESNEDTSNKSSLAPSKQDVNRTIKSYITLKNVIAALIISIVIIDIIILIISRIKGKKKKTSIYMSVLLLLTLGFASFFFNSSYALSNGSKSFGSFKVVSKTSDSARLKWNKIDSAKSYQLCYKRSDVKKYKCNKNINTTSDVITGLRSDAKYYFKVKANLSGKNTMGILYSNPISTTTYKGEKHYDYMNSNDKKIYRIIYNGMKSRKETVSFGYEVDNKKLNKIWMAVLYDHPGLFNVEFYYPSGWGTTDKQGYLAKAHKIKLGYNSLNKNYVSNKKKFENEADKIVKKAKIYKTKYEREQFVAYYLAKHVTYDYDGLKKDGYTLHQSAYSAIVKKDTVCAGYSKAFSYIMQKLGYTSSAVNGMAKTPKGGGRHAWNLVKLKDGYYNLDVTWMATNHKNAKADTSAKTGTRWFNQESHGDPDFKYHHRSGYSAKIPHSQGSLYLGFNDKFVLDLDSNPGVISIGGKKTLKLKYDSNYVKKSKLKWSSSAPNVISVNKNGKISANNVGSAVITVKESTYNIMATKKIKVSASCVYYKNKYYDKNGKVINQATYYKSCNPKCEIRGGKYYDKTGKSVTKNEYNKSCNNTSSDSATNEEDVYEVTYNIISGKKEETIEVKEGKTIVKPLDPVREGYLFKGWYTDENYKTLYNFNKPINNDIDLYAKWELKTYTITFDSNGGSSVDKSVVSYDSEVTKPDDPIKAGYYFAGWYKGSNLQEKFSFKTLVKNNYVLYAKWSSAPITTHDVTFIPGHGMDPFIVEVNHGDKVDNRTLTSNDEDIKFAGWYLYNDINDENEDENAVSDDEGKEGLYDFNTAITEDTYLKGRWVTSSGEEIIDTPDTASPVQIIGIALGVILVLGGGYFIFKPFNIKPSDNK